MKHFISTICICLFTFSLWAQTNFKKESKLWNLIKGQFEQVLKTDPKHVNQGLDWLNNYITKKDSTYGKWLNDLNLEFKTFQNQDSEVSSLGLGYEINFERANIKENKHIRNGKSLVFETKGNVAFNKNVNPYNFLNSKLSLNFFNTGGGVEITNPNLDLIKLSDLRKKLATKDVAEIPKSEEYKVLTSSFKIRNSFVLKYNANVGFESNQNFTEMQSTFGLRLGLGLKSWDSNSTASKLNIFDYPFELIRKLTKYKGTIHKGVTIPSLLFGFDYVNPIDDSIREGIEGELKAHSRFNFEVGFRSVVSELYGQTIYFNNTVYELGFQYKF